MVKNYAKKGYGVALNHIGEAEAEADELILSIKKETSYAHILKVEADVTQRSQVKKMFQKAIII